MPDYGKIINKSIQTTQKFKWLWVYGIAIAATTGASSGGNFNNISNNFKNNDNVKFPLPSSTPNSLPTFEKSKDVLGAFTSSVSDWAAHVSPQTWSLLILAVIISIVASIAISWVLTSWLEGSLIAGLKLAHQNKETNLKNTSALGMAKIKDLIVVGVIQFFFGLLAFLALVAVGLLTSFVLIPIERNLAPPVYILMFIAGFTLLIQFGITNVLAPRAVVLENLSPMNAWSKAWKLATKNYFPSILMGIVSGISAAAFGCITNIVLLVVCGIPAAIFVIPMVTQFADDKNFNPGNYVVNIFVLCVLVAIFAIANLFIRGLTVVFTKSNWNLWFEEINKQTNK